VKIYKPIQPADHLSLPAITLPDNSRWVRTYEGPTIEVSWDFIAELEPMIFESDDGSRRVKATFEEV